MPKYKVLIQGTNIPSGKTLAGFYGTRFVLAINPRTAELRAVDLVRTEITQSISVAALQKANARMFMKTIEKIEHLPRHRGKGFVWYNDEGSGQSALDLELLAHWK